MKSPATGNGFANWNVKKKIVFLANGRSQQNLLALGIRRDLQDEFPLAQMPKSLAISNPTLQQFEIAAIFKSLQFQLRFLPSLSTDLTKGPRSTQNSTRSKSGESNRPLNPILLKSIAIHLPFLSRYFCKSMPSSWQKVAYTPPICITIRLPFVSRYFCGSIRVRGRWDTPK